MEVWARRYRGQCQFLCVCVESKQVAVAFGQMFQLKAAINCYIPGRNYMPVGYGQLGCSGFIIADSTGCFVSQKTRAYLDYGEDAFFDVEDILARELNVVPPPPPGSSVNSTTRTLHPDYPYQKGSRVVMEGISSQPLLNGTVVVILGFDSISGRFQVQLQDGSEKRLSILPCSLAPYKESSSDVNSNNNNSDNAAATLTSIATPPSVGNASMDHEHDICTTALNKLLGEPSQEKLQTVIDALDSHFRHEEELMKTHGFGGDATSSFSALASHIKDHQRILDIGRQVLMMAETKSSC